MDHIRTPSPKIHYPVKRPSSLSSKMSRVLGSTPKRMTKRSKIPPPLSLDPLTPPPTVQKNKEYQLESPAVFLSGINSTTTDLDLESPLFKHSTKLSSKRQKKSILNELCSICEEPITSKLSGEKTIELECDHLCHFNCYLLLLNKENLDELPICSICSKPCKPAEDDILQELYSQTLILDSPVISKHQLHTKTYTPSIPQSYLLASPMDYKLPDIPFSGFKPFFNFRDGVTTPYTPQNQMTNNLSPNGFQPLSRSTIRKNGSATTSRSTSSSNLNTSSSRSSSSRFSTVDGSHINKYSAHDLIKPIINVIPEFSKHVINKNIPNFAMKNLINIFTNELDNECGADQRKPINELEIKQQIHEFIIDLFIKDIKDSKGITFKELPFLQLFDFIEISLDGSNWEYVHCFVFKDVLILINEEFDTIIGTIQIGQHFSNLIKLNEETLQLYFSSTTLPELQVKSTNKILITKWEDYFQLKLKRKELIPLIQMTTNLWEIITNSTVEHNIEIPSDIVKFNELTAKGLDLPINLMKSVLPKPQSLQLNLVIAIQLFNYTKSSNHEYLKNLKTVIKNVLNGLDDTDRLGLVLIGRDGSRNQDYQKNSFVGMINSKWDGWDEFLDELEVFDNAEYETMIDKTENFINTIEKLNVMISTIPDLSFDELKTTSIKKVLMINNGWETKADKFFIDEENVEELDKLMKGYEFSLHHVVINESYDCFNEDLIEQLKDLDGVKGYSFERFNSFDSFVPTVEPLVQKFKKVMIPKLKLNFEIEMTSYMKFKTDSIDTNLKNPYSFEIQLKDLHDGFFKNLRVNTELDVSNLLKNFQFTSKSLEFFDLPVFKLTYSYLNKSYVKKFTSKISINPSLIQSTTAASDQDSILSPIEPQTITTDRQSRYIDIPLLPPLSAFKDSIFVKKQLELLAIKTLEDILSGAKGAKPIQDVTTLIFGMIRGCSTNYMDFYKQSSFKKYKNFTNYVNELIKKLNKLKGNEVLMKDMLYKLCLEEEI